MSVYWFNPNLLRSEWIVCDRHGVLLGSLVCDTPVSCTVAFQACKEVHPQLGISVHPKLDVDGYLRTLSLIDQKQEAATNALLKELAERGELNDS